MEMWMQVAGISGGVLCALFAALVVPRPRVCLRIAQMVGTFAVSIAGTATMGAVGAYLAKRAILQQAAATYAITDGESLGDSWIRDNIAAAADPVLGQFLGLGGICLMLLAICAGAVYVARMVIADGEKDRAIEHANAKPHRRE